MPFVASTWLRKLTLLLLSCAAIVALGAWMVQSPLPDLYVESLVGGWLCIAFFGFGVIVTLVRIVGTHHRGDVHIPISMLITSSKNVMGAVEPYWPPRDR